MSEIDKKIDRWEDEIAIGFERELNRVPNGHGIENHVSCLEREQKMLNELKASQERCASGKCDGYDKGYLDSKYEVELIEHRTKEAIRTYLDEHADVKTEYGPHGVSICYYSQDDVVDAIDNCKVGGD